MACLRRRTGWIKSATGSNCGTGGVALAACIEEFLGRQ
jgi:hypothetical protein